MAGYADTRAVASQDGQQVDLCLRYVEVDQSTALEGLGGLTQASIAKPVVKGGSADKGIELSIPLTIVSPSKDIVLNSNTDAVYAMQYQGATVGSVIVPQFSVRPGTNTYTVQSFVKPDTGNSNAVAATRALLTAFTGKQQVQIQAVNGRTSGMPSLDAAFGAVSFNLALPPNTDDLIVSTSFRFPNLLALTADANLVAHNAFDAPVGITHITATLTYSGMTIGTVDADIAGFTIAAKGQATSPTFTLKLKLDVASIKALLVTIVGKPILVNVASTLTVNFGGYSTVLDYTQNNVPTTLNV
ncbi:hypothetical protein DFJ73DRAFT_851254 [Zopfochytrium polystomum]|nr:hypothetical protein DFJ73DRAFT_851254 [Zopfochytrium polystomum]